MNVFTEALNHSGLRGQLHTTSGEKAGFIAALLIAESEELGGAYSPVVGRTFYDEVVTRFNAAGLPPYFVRQLDTLVFAEGKQKLSRGY